jgi:hypothetical protein
MQSITVVPYYVALAHGNVRLNLQIGIVSVVVITPLLIVLIIKYGLAGAGLSFLVMNLCTLPSYMYLLHRRFLRGELQEWIWCDVLRPSLPAIPIILPSSRLLALGFVGLLWSVSSVAAACTLPELRSVWTVQLKPRLCLPF